MKLRPEVQAFAEAMEIVLSKNDYKHCSTEYLFNCMKIKINKAEEFSNAMEVLNRLGSDKELEDKLNKSFCHELIDIANFIIIVWDLRTNK